jgi:hypothetical protein
MTRIFGGVRPSVCAITSRGLRREIAPLVLKFSDLFLKRGYVIRFCSEPPIELVVSILNCLRVFLIQLFDNILKRFEE